VGCKVHYPNPEGCGGVKIIDTPLPGVKIITPDLLIDNRGYFARTFCLRELFAAGISMKIVQCSISYNAIAGTVRGLHFQKEPYGEDKIVSCIRGKIIDVVVDLKTHIAFNYVLSDSNRQSIFIPKGYAHGFQTLMDDTIVYYQMSEYYNPNAVGTVKWDRWSEPITAISERDAI
jgi:dTDP-4-dehydrorhamnose 3,5-epimerase